MTAIPRTIRGPSPVLFILTLVLLVALAVPALAPTIHAGLHTEADIIRRCVLDPANLQQIWLNSSGERLNCLTLLPDGKTGDYVIQWCKKAGWIEITAYIMGDGSLATATRTLKAKMCQQVWP